jgi:hypothetical protein
MFSVSSDLSGVVVAARGGKERPATHPGAATRSQEDHYI